MHASEPRDKQMEIREDRKTDPELHKLNPILYRIFNAFANITEPRLQFKGEISQYQSLTISVYRDVFKFMKNAVGAR
jgi:hypothetical protein